jgi:hypothetical protein
VLEPQDRAVPEQRVTVCGRFCVYAAAKITRLWTFTWLWPMLANELAAFICSKPLQPKKVMETAGLRAD